jgi:hypothetical protein
VVAPLGPKKLDEVEDRLPTVTNGGDAVERSVTIVYADGVVAAAARQRRGKEVMVL